MMPPLGTRTRASLIVAVAGAGALVQPGRAGAAGPVYRLVPEVDVPVIATAAGISLGWMLSSLMPPAHCAPLCDDSGLNALDRPFAGTWEPSWARASDAGLGALLVGAYATLALAEGPGNALNDTVVVAESWMVATALSVLTTAATRRPRPYVYGDAAPLEDRQLGDGALSFFSGHTASAFALAVSFAETVRRIDPDSGLYWVALGVGLAGAAFVGTARIAAGKHFPSDVLVGALVGSSVGVAVPYLHEAAGDARIAAALDGSTVTASWAF